MFGRGKTEDKPTKQRAPGKAGEIETVIGPNTHFRGDIQSDGGARVEGVFEGTIDVTGNLIIGEGAKVIADISAHNISSSGGIKGDINGNKGESLENGRDWGNLTVNSRLLNEGAYLRGNTTMQGDIEPPMIEPPKESKAPEAKATIVDVEPKVKEKEEEG